MTDGLGSASHSYNQLSRMTSETRQFADPVAPYLNGSFTLSYSYNLAGELAGITDPTGLAVAYGYDNTGRLSNVTGDTFAGVSQYATGMQYRAFNGLKSLRYGNSQTLSQGYNGRQQLASFQVGATVSAQFQYHADGRIRYAKDNAEPKMDRSYNYDQVGRLSEGLSGGEARGENVADGVYRQTYQYDVWSNLLGRAVNRFWSGGEPFTDTYINNRQQGAGYDADGRVTSDPSDRTHTYDASGQQTMTSEVSRASSWAGGALHPSMPAGGYYTTTTLTIVQSYDGDGRSLKRVETKTQSTPFYQPVTTQRVDYYLRSSVLGGQVITELSAAGQKNKTKVYFAGTVLAEQQLYSDGQQSISWKHMNPVTGTEAASGPDGSVGGKKEYDPFGLELGDTDPYLQNAEPDYASMGGSFYRGGGNPFGEESGCQWDGMPVRCEMFGFILRTQSLVEIQIGRDVDRGFINGMRWVDTTDRSNVKSRVIGLDEKGNPVGQPGDWSTPPAPTPSGYWEFSLISLQVLQMATPQNPAATPTPCPGSIPEGIGRQINAIAAQEHIDPTLLSVTMRHESSFGTNMTPNPRYAGRGSNRRVVGWDVGPMGTATNIWNKSPFTDGLSGDPFGSIMQDEKTHQYISFNGDFEANITVAARAFSMDILPRSGGKDPLADAAGMYRGPGDYQGRYNQYVREAPGDRQQLKCIGGRR